MFVTAVSNKASTPRSQPPIGEGSGSFSAHFPSFPGAIGMLRGDWFVFLSFKFHMNKCLLLEYVVRHLPAASWLADG